MSETYIFVYGSLLSCLKNNYKLENSKYIGDYTSEKLFHMVAYQNKFPYLLELSIDKPKTNIKGEIYKVDSYILKKLDILETHPDIYQRQLHRFTNGKETIEAYVYILVKPLIIDYILSNYNSSYYFVESGDWKDYLYKNK